MEEEGFFSKSSESEGHNEESSDGDKGGEKEGDKGEDDKNDKNKKRGYPILSCDHSAITGESLAVDRYMGEVIYYTTACKRGKAYAVVQMPAKISFVGRTASMVAGAKTSGHFEHVMNDIGTSLLVLVMAWILVAWIGGFFRHLPIAARSGESQSLLHFTLALLIIGVPVGLPVVTTTTMAVGAAYLAKKRAIVQKLTAIESLAVCISFDIFMALAKMAILVRASIFSVLIKLVL
jgi:H+-transporting ATPase